MKYGPNAESLSNTFLEIFYSGTASPLFSGHKAPLVPG
ncbi:DNA-binding protein [Salmonella phage SeF2]|uniref:Uncharacterized protein n=1 Tax=Salmonella phage PMBT19 TaxID=3229743 RepID=A0AB39C0Y3_9CAUD|nr:DNA-binding protein [Salmonella phage SeF2]